METVSFIDYPANFYLGARVDPSSHTVMKDMPIYYDARDLLTHAVILGMTGSGKTGLGISLLEEAALDNVPLLIIDPKGDITNMMLAFPDLDARYFRDWVNPDEASQQGQSLDQYAYTVAERWRNGLGEWGITNDRVQEFRHSSRFSIYTPGSEAGLQISILKSLAAPAEGWAGNEERLREQISGTVTAILALVGISASPVEDPRHVLLSNIFEFNWRNQRDLSMEQLIVQVQEPPFTKLGALELDSVLPARDRSKLARSLNNIIAAPNFQSWIQGEPLDIQSLLFTPEGYRRTTIVYVAHLNDAERQFILTLLLESVLTWMRARSGATTLQALLYIDEVYGMMPPYPLNPPTKSPILRMLKQARAFGLGVILSTQNPKDIDYKGLSNIGTWWIGKLQTENDKQRVLEGLDSARDATSTLDIGQLDRLISDLGPREFIVHNIHKPDTPYLMRTRWAMSYLRGPLTRDQISILMANQRGIASQAPPQVMAAQPAAGALPAHGGYTPAISPNSLGGQGSMQGQQFNQQAAPPPTTYTVDPSYGQPVEMGQPLPPGFTAQPPKLAAGVYQYFLPTDYHFNQAVRYWEVSTRQPVMTSEANKRLLYRPSLLAQAVVRYDHKASGTTDMRTFAFVVPTLPNSPYLNWGDYWSDPFDPQALDPHPFAEALYAKVPDGLAQGAGFRDLQNNLMDWIYQNMAVVLYQNKVLKLMSGLGEARRDFVARVQAAARVQRDAEIDKVTSRYDKQIASLEERARSRMDRLQKEKSEHGDRQREELLSGIESLNQLVKGNIGFVFSRTSRLRRYTEQSKEQAGVLENDIKAILDQIDGVEAEMQQTLQGIHDKWVNVVQQIDELRINPYKKDIALVVFGLGWVPYWDATINGQPVILPASSSGLSYRQDPTVGGGYYNTDSYYSANAGGYDQGYQQTGYDQNYSSQQSGYNTGYSSGGYGSSSSSGGYDDDGGSSYRGGSRARRSGY